MQLKPGPNYKMSKALKTSLALGKYRNAEDRNAWKRAMIGAELAAAIKPKERKKGQPDLAE